MTIVVGIFDNPKNLDEAIVKLAEQGLEDTVFDESIVAQEMGVSRLGPEHKNALVTSFKKHLLKDYHVSAEVTNGYVTSFFHGGKFVVVKTNAKGAEQAMEIMRGNGATRVNRHD